MEAVMEPILEISQLTKSFDGKPVLKGVDFTVHPGEIIGYIGPNGAGKSTTVKLFLGCWKETGERFDSSGSR